MKLINDRNTTFGDNPHRILVYPPDINYYKTHTFKDLFNDYVFEKQEVKEAKNTLLPRRSSILREIESTQNQINELLVKKTEAQGSISKVDTGDQSDLENKITGLNSTISQSREAKGRALTELNELNQKLENIERGIFNQAPTNVGDMKRQIQEAIANKKKEIKQIELNADTVLAEKSRIQQHLNSLRTFENKNKTEKQQIIDIDSSIITKLDSLKQNIIGDLNRLRLRLEDLEKENVQTKDSRAVGLEEYKKFMTEKYNSLLSLYSEVVDKTLMGQRINDFIAGMKILFDFNESYRIFSDIIYVTTLFFLKEKYNLQPVYRIYSFLTAQILNTEVYIRNE